MVYLNAPSMQCVYDSLSWLVQHAKATFYDALFKMLNIKDHDFA